MNFKNLLSLSAFALGAFASANAADQYLIQNGKFAEGVEILAYGEDADGTPIVYDPMEETTAPDNTPAVSITHKNTYKDVRFYVADGIDINENWCFEIEYYYTDSSAFSACYGKAKKPVLVFGCVEDTVGGHYGYDDNFYSFYRDVKFTSSENTWKTETVKLPIKPSISSFKMLTMAYLREAAEIKDSQVFYIKNMKFTNLGNRPFFAEDFNTLMPYQNEASGATIVYKYINADGSFKTPTSVTVSTNNPLTSCTKLMTSGIPVYAEITDNCKMSKAVVKALRLFEDEGTDGSGYMDTEIFAGMQITNQGTRADSRAYFFIPTEGVVADNIDMDFISKWDARQTTSKLTADTDPDSLALPIYYGYVDEIAQIPAENLTLVNDTFKIDGKWRAYKASFAFDNTKKYLVLAFAANIAFDYTVDELYLTSDKATLTGVTFEEYDGVSAYTMVETSGVESIRKDVELAIYPNPATSEVVVANEGVNSVAIYSLAGTMVAAENGNKINVSNLANGVYIIKAYTNDGVIANQIIKK